MTVSFSKGCTSSLRTNSQSVVALLSYNAKILYMYQMYPHRICGYKTPQTTQHISAELQCLSLTKLYILPKPLSIYEKIMANLIMFSATNKICSTCILFSNPIHIISPINENRNCKCVSAQIYKQGSGLD